MPSMSEAIKSLKAGTIDVNAAAEQIKAALAAPSEGSAPVPEDPGYADYALQRVADKDDTGYEASFNKVTAAWIGGDLTDGQYHSIREIVLPNSGKQG